MKESPILFSAPMIRAIIAGAKWQTRRIIRPQPELAIMDSSSAHALSVAKEIGIVPDSERPRWRWRGTFAMPWPQALRHDGPYGMPGDRLWVRETWAAVWPGEDEVPIRECTIEYRADLPVGCQDGPGQWPVECKKDSDAPKWRPSIHMPRWASRIVLEVTDVCVERLQDIGEIDALAEGVDSYECLSGPARPCARSAFAELWNAINGKRAPWMANPWVWAVSFKRVQP